MTSPPPATPAPGTAGQLLEAFGSAVSAHDWAGLRALIADDARMHYLHTDEWFEPDAFVALARDYPGDWTYHCDEVVDGGERAVLHSRTVIGNEVSHCATFASATGGRLTELVELWTEPVAPHSQRSTEQRNTT